MSDDEQNGGWGANFGITLPDRVDATYNVGLSPIFVNRSGFSRINQSTGIDARAQGSYIWSATIMSATNRKHAVFNLQNAWPSTGDAGYQALSLRCLVSTNNRIMKKNNGYTPSFQLIKPPSTLRFCTKLTLVLVLIQKFAI